MPAVLRIGGWRMVIDPNDHERPANEVLRQLASHQDALLAGWTRFRG